MLLRIEFKIGYLLHSILIDISVKMHNSCLLEDVGLLYAASSTSELIDDQIWKPDPARDLLLQRILMCPNPRPPRIRNHPQLIPMLPRSSSILPTAISSAGTLMTTPSCGC
jgi:hypothetical protein